MTQFHDIFEDDDYYYLTMGESIFYVLLMKYVAWECETSYRSHHATREAGTYEIEADQRKNQNIRTRAHLRCIDKNLHTKTYMKMSSLPHRK